MTWIWRKCTLATGQKSSHRSSGQAGSKSKAPWPWALYGGSYWFTMDTKGEVCTCRFTVQNCELCPSCIFPGRQNHNLYWNGHKAHKPGKTSIHPNWKTTKLTANPLVLFIFGFRHRQAWVGSKDKMTYFCVASIYWVVGCSGLNL